MLLNMRRYLLTFIICLFAVSAFPQTGTTVSIEVGDLNQHPLANIEVMLQEKGTQEKLTAYTNTTGKVDFSITTGHNWALHIGGYPYPKEVIKRDDNSENILSLYITHNPVFNDRLNQQTFIRNIQKLSIIDQAGLVFSTTKPGTFNIEIKVVNSDGRLQQGKQVHVLCLSENKMYMSVTNAKGLAMFQLPNNNAYDIDVAEQFNASFIDKDLPDGFVFYKTIVYDTYDMVETNQHDTITQNIQLPLVRKNSRAPYSVQMQWKNGNPCRNEPVYLNEIIGNKVYMATTDSAGEALFILPFGEKYLVNFNFQKDVDVLDLTDARGRAEGSLSLIYEPNPALEFPEKFIPTSAELSLTDFSYYHKTPYPQPKQITKPGILLRTGAPASSPGNNEIVLEVGIGTFHMPTSNRANLNVSFVLDKSGSMAGYERIESLKAGLENMIGKLSVEDRISIILFDDDMELLLPSTKIGNDKKRIIELIRAIQPNGGTDMLKAMEAAYAEVLNHYTASAVNTVILLTDGYDSNPVEVLMEAQKPYNAKISCTAIGVGKDYNYDLMKQLAGKGNGSLIFAAEGKELVDLFGKNMLNLANPVAKNVSIVITIPPALQYTKSFGAGNEKITGTTFSASLPDLYLGMEIPILLHFLVKNRLADKTILVNLHYLNPATGKREMVSETIKMMDENTFTTGKLPIMDAEQKKMYVVAVSNGHLLKMASAFEKGDTDKANRSLEQGIAQLTALYPAKKDKDLEALQNTMKKYRMAFLNIANKNKLKR